MILKTKIYQCLFPASLLKVVCIFIFLFITICLSTLPATANTLYSTTKKDSTKESVKVKVIAGNKDCIFNRKYIRYKIDITNTYKTAQEGTVVYEVRNDRNKQLFGGVFNVHVNAKGILSIPIKFTVNAPGFYEISSRINVTDYDDTIATVFGYKPKLIRTPLHKPADFDKFWEDAKADLKKVEPKYTIEYSKTQSNSTHKFYNVEMQSLDNITIHGWISIPRLAGKFPVILVMPGYKQILQPFFPDDQAIFCLTVRSVSQMNKANKNPHFESEYCMVNIDDKNNFIYRGAYMDCLRAVDFLFANYKLGLDTNRIIVFGGSQGGSFALVTAALDHRVSICGADNPIYCDMHNYYEIANNKRPDAFPIKYYNQYLRQTAIQKETLLRTLDYFDVQNFIPNIKCPVLIALGTLDPIAPPACVYAAYNKVGPAARRKSEIHILSNVGHEITEEYSFIKFLWIEENTVEIQGH